nr:tRNA (adenosine(37)-N6)-threonylcarbamoyltransferase complex ATPase subunit type 1 TsaE [Melioribacteraceae bacterium]
MSLILVDKIISSEKETEEIAIKLAKQVECGDIIALSGNLGAGKTFFTKAFCSVYDIDEVVSPSFSIVNEYYGDKKVFHFDFYRLKNIDELAEIGFYDYLNDEY